MSIQNFPRIPKIILRNPCGESKEAKKQFKHHDLVWRSDKNSTGTLAFELPTGWSVKGLSMANCGFPSETGHKYENYRSQSHAGTIGAVSIFNSIVLSILLVYGKIQKCDFWFFSQVSKYFNIFKIFNSEMSKISKISKFQNRSFSVENIFRSQYTFCHRLNVSPKRCYWW